MHTNDETRYEVVVTYGGDQSGKGSSAKIGCTTTPPLPNDRERFVMSKAAKHNERWERRLEDIEKASKSEWQRLVEQNRELFAELGRLRARHNITTLTVKDVIHWMDNESHEVRMHFGRELNEILAKHGIPEKWRVNLFYWALTGRHVIGIAHSIGFPRGEWSRDESGQFKHQIIIDSETDVANPIVQDYIRHFQLLEDPPPQPQPMKDNPREKDWRPVWEWRKRHPGVTHQEIAKMLSYSPTTVRHKLAQFEEK